MNTKSLAFEYLNRCKKRLEALKVLYKEKSYADVVRESQEIVELCGKGILRCAGIDPPKWHDVGDLIIELSQKYYKFEKKFKKYAEISGWLRKERELAFYGDIDFIPSERYGRKEAKKALKGAEFSISLLEKFLKL
ncbi:MAG: HEPN domain-containing protein [candidate division WOR-3 bacterium]